MRNLSALFRFLGGFILVASFLISITGCSSSSSKSTVGGVLNLDTDLDLTFVIDKSVNPDEHKRPSPVVIRLYELKSSVVFAKADFVDLFERDTDVLKGEYVDKIMLKAFTPGETRSEHLILQKGTQQIALYAEFSQYRGSIFKVIVPVTLNNVKANSYSVKVTGTELSLVKK